MTHVLTEYFKLKLGTIKRDRRKAVEIIAIKDDFVHFEAHISGNPNCHQIHNRLLELGLVKVKLQKTHKTPLEFYKTVFKQFTKQVNQNNRYECIQSSIHDYSRYRPSGGVIVNIHTFTRGEIYFLQNVEEDHIYVRRKNSNKIISIRKKEVSFILKKI